MNTITKFVAAGAGAVVLVAGGGAAYATATSTLTAPKVTVEQAIEIAHKQVPGAWVKEVSYDARETRPDVWEVEVVKGDVEHELDVDAATGKVLSQGTDRTDDDG
ncbi:MULTISPECIES: PepSY domain-containing protein [unclassified Nonomuraea]|uniref:PepSY domain-containing protein n=1 Tax=unclassified Nonomuraea TaxID=2593643 RepID=UPI0033CF8D6B